MQAEQFDERPEASAERHHEVASELWGDHYLVRVTEWADGSQQCFAIRNRGLVNPDGDDELYGRDVLFVFRDDTYELRHEIIDRTEPRVPEDGRETGTIEDLLGERDREANS